MSDAAAEPRVFSVAELTGMVKGVLEATFPSVWVAGEIGDLSRPQSGHVYFSLRDSAAQLAAVVWRTAAARIRFDLHDGLEVVCRGRLEVYAPRGRYQLIVEQMAPQGIGALELALRQLRDKLAREGLFDPARKRPLPRFVRRIAVVTSPTGAAIRDFLEVLRRRWSGVDVLIVPVRVQGEGAGDEIAEAVRLVNRLRAPIDCLVVTRGGGSLEDLWAFNEEAVVRAIAASAIPVVSGVGHEIDVTLADLAADVRALTPSEAAERVVPSQDEMAQLLRHHGRRLAASLAGRVNAARQRYEAIASRQVFRRPDSLLFDRARTVDELEGRIVRASGQAIDRAQRRLETAAGRLASLSPLGVLARGYSVTTTAEGRVVRDAAELATGQTLHTRFARGTAVGRVEAVGE